MKLQSELYIQELAMMLHGINLQVNEISRVLRKQRRMARVQSFFMPWRKRVIWTSLAVVADLMMNHVSVLSELREKILKANGTDDDMLPITLEEILAKELGK